MRSFSLSLVVWRCGARAARAAAAGNLGWSRSLHASVQAGDTAQTRDAAGPGKAAMQTPQVGVACVVFDETRLEDPHVLLIQRKNPPAAGLWTFPGGRLALGETVQEGAVREAVEETGITPSAVGPLIKLAEVITRRGDERKGNDSSPSDVLFHYVVLDFIALGAGHPVAKDDALDARWLRAATAADTVPCHELVPDMIESALALLPTFTQSLDSTGAVTSSSVSRQGSP